MERRLFPKVCFALLSVSALCSSAPMLGEELEPIAVEASATLTDSFHSELDTLGGDACPKCDGTRSACCCGHFVDWTKVPGSIRPLPRPGNFPIPRAGHGYYSAWDQLTGTCRDKPPKSGYPPFALMAPSFFDADFRYVESLDYSDRTLVDK